MDDEADDQDLWWPRRRPTESEADALFERIAARSALDEDHELFDEYMMDRFILRVSRGEPVEGWIMRWVAETFAKILAGSEFHDHVHLWFLPRTPVRPWREQRDLEVACEIFNRAKPREVTATIEAVAVEHTVSFECARAAYYKWRPVFLKSVAKHRKN